MSNGVDHDVKARGALYAAPLVVLVGLLSSCGFGGNDSGAQMEAQIVASESADSAAPALTGDTAPEAAAAVEPEVDPAASVLLVDLTDDGATTANAESESGDLVTLDANSTPESNSATDGSENQTADTPAPTTPAPTTATPATQATPTTVAPTTVAAPTTRPPAAPTTVPAIVATTEAPPTTPAPTTTAPPAPANPGGLTYKGILAAGDNEITAFDNARKTIKDLFVGAGVQPQNLIELSSQRSEQGNGVRATSTSAMGQAMSDLNVGEGDACIVFITSHGSRQAWFIRGDRGLTPNELDRILNDSCGNRPTVALVSACYSGIFIDPLARPNRVVLTAASASNTSFGCSPEATYTYWDGCLIDHFNQASTWEDLYQRVTGCIETKEARAGVTPSRPQAHFGSEVTNLSVLNR